MLRYDFHNNTKGGIEGLPMELLLIIVIAALGTAVIISWMGDVQNNVPKSYGDVGSDTSVISTDGTLYFVNESSEGTAEFSVTVHVRDVKGDGISGAVVRITGLGISSKNTTYGLTDQNGNITFEKLTVSAYSKGGMGYLSVTVDSDIGNKEFKIPVVMI